MAARIRAGVNTALSVGASPQLVHAADPIKGGPSIQNVGEVDDVIHVWQGEGVPTASSPAFVLQRYALIEFPGAQQTDIYVWASVGASGTLPVAAVSNGAE